MLDILCCKNYRPSVIELFSLKYLYLIVLISSKMRLSDKGEAGFASLYVQLGVVSIAV